LLRKEITERPELVQDLDFNTSNQQLVQGAAA